MARDNNDRQVAQTLLEHVEEVQAIEFRPLEPDVQNHKRRPAVLDGCKSRVAVARLAGLVAFILQDFEISSRISASSSTIRISAIIHRIPLGSRPLPGTALRLPAGLGKLALKNQPDPCSGSVRSILHHQPPPVLLHDALYDGETKAGTFVRASSRRARSAGDDFQAASPMPLSVTTTIRLLRIVFDLDHDSARRLRVRLLARLDRLSRIFHEVGHRLRRQPPVEASITGRSGRSMSISTSLALTRCSIVASLIMAIRSCVSRTALGIRANEENSSTIRPISPT